MNTKKQTNEKITLVKEYATIGDDILSNYRGINGYHCQNNNWRTITNGFGVELELQNADYDTRDRLSRYLNYKFKMNIEKDSSLCNSSYPMEIITQPYSISEWLSNKETIKQFFELIEAQGLYADYQTGLHIHISNKLIGKNETIRENNINKLILILENYKDTFKKFARRESFSYCDFMSNYHGQKTYKDLYAIKKNKCYSHSTCINRDTKTYELRIFQATISSKTFIATLQLVDNLVKVINKEDISDITFNDIINLNTEYTELINYCKENKISNNNKIIDKTKVIELLQLRKNSKILKENYNYNRYIDKVRTLYINNEELYLKSKEEFKEKQNIYDELEYIFTKTYINNNSIYYQFFELNKLLSRYKTKYIIDIKNDTSASKRVFNPEYKEDYSKLYNKLVNLIKSKGGVI